MRRWLLRILFPLLLLVVLVHCASRTEPSPLPPGVKKEHLKLQVADQAISLTLYRPTKDENAPLIVVAHGLLRSKRYMAGWGGHLAGQGFFVVVRCHGRSRHGQAVQDNGTLQNTFHSVFW